MKLLPSHAGGRLLNAAGLAGRLESGQHFTASRRDRPKSTPPRMEQNLLEPCPEPRTTNDSNLSAYVTTKLGTQAWQAVLQSTPSPLTTTTTPPPDLTMNMVILKYWLDDRLDLLMAPPVDLFRPQFL